MTRPWQAETTLTADQAGELIEEQFPQLAPARVELAGEGWDNLAFRVGEEWVFRFPRRAIAVDLLRTEAAVLPAVAPRLPLPVPVPHFLGEPSERFGWPFAGYRWLGGETACRANLSEAQRKRCAAPLGAFLKALHAIPADEARSLGAGSDTLQRLEVPKRRAMCEERLAKAKELGLLDDVRPWLEALEDVPEDWSPGGSTLVHGDLYSRHLLVSSEDTPAGIIDWGDLHLGDAAIDLAMAHVFLPPSAREAFFDAYGSVDDDTWRIARLRGLFSAITILVYGADIGDAALRREGRIALGHVLDQSVLG